MGSVYGFIIRDRNPQSSKRNEFGCSEVEKMLEEYRNKTIKKRRSKLIRTLKDMLDLLITRKSGNSDGLCTVGVIHSGNIKRIVYIYIYI
jgi:hypothetical protein